MPSERDVPEVVVLPTATGRRDRCRRGVAAAGARCVVCCDGAARRYLAGAAYAYAIVGDRDSPRPRDRRGMRSGLVHRIAEQDTNDQTKAVRFCLERGMRRIVILRHRAPRGPHAGNVSLLADYYAAEGAGGAHGD